MRRVLTVVALVAMVLTACGRRDVTVESEPSPGCDGLEATPGSVVTCDVPGWPGRSFDLHLPDEYDPADAWPVVIAYHGGGGTREAGARTTCPDGDLDDLGCLHALGAREGFITVYPDGTGATRVGRFRTWNAGGEDPYTCAVGAACEQEADDIAYTADLLDELDTHYSIHERVVVTGLSNGAAMAHRAGCDLPDRVAVVVAFGGTNQQPGCAPSPGVSVMQVHGTDDPCWPYEGVALGGCLGGEALVSSVEQTMEGWVDVLDCGDPVVSDLPDSAPDGLVSTMMRWDECRDGAIVQLVTVEGGGHTWPSGYSVAPRIVGPSTTDFNGSELLWEFAREAMAGDWGLETGD